jgi:GLPGLI family protein
MIRCLWFFFAVTTMQAQSTGALEYTYQRNFAINYRTIATLDFNTFGSKYLVLKSNEASNEIIVNKEGKDLNLISPESKHRPQFYVDRVQDTLISLEKKYGKSSTVKEVLPKIRWQLKKEFKNLNKIKCQKATGYFRGRTYIAWFAKDIPVPYGPWKLNGLPGLILEAYDSKNEIVWKLKKISLGVDKTLEIPNYKNGTPIKEYITVIAPEMEKQVFELMKARVTNRNVTITPFVEDRLTYSEIVYEWEDGYPKQE